MWNACAVLSQLCAFPSSAGWVHSLFGPSAIFYTPYIGRINQHGLNGSRVVECLTVSMPSRIAQVFKIVGCIAFNNVWQRVNDKSRVLRTGNAR